MQARDFTQAHVVHPPTAFFESDQARRITLAHGDNQLALQVFGSGNNPLIVTHGLQSHSGWFGRSAEELARHDLMVVCFDRSGSGCSTGARGECKNFHSLIDEMALVAHYALRQCNATQVHLLGHCFGAVPALAYACKFPEQVTSVALASPALYTRTGPKFLELLQIILALSLHRKLYLPIPFTTEMLSEVCEHQASIDRDELALTEVTANLYFEIYRARRFILRHIDALTMPVLMLLAGQDQIVKNQRNREFWARLPAVRKRVMEYPSARHILELSFSYQRFIEELVSWFESFTRSKL